MANINDFLGPDGNVNWEAYKKAQIEDGDICMLCGEYTLLTYGEKKKRTCSACSKLENKRDTVCHAHFIRCPKCKDHWDPRENEDDVFEEGEHLVCCPKCDYEFEVTTYVSYDFESPELEDTDEED